MRIHVQIVNTTYTANGLRCLITDGSRKLCKVCVCLCVSSTLPGLGGGEVSSAEVELKLEREAYVRCGPRLQLLTAGSRALSPHPAPITPQPNPAEAASLGFKGRLLSSQMCAFSSAFRRTSCGYWTLPPMRLVPFGSLQRQTPTAAKGWSAGNRGAAEKGCALAGRPAPIWPSQERARV